MMSLSTLYPIPGVPVQFNSRVTKRSKSARNFADLENNLDSYQKAFN